ncbi:MAG TPA: BTAD domain-containing putative transcriptional regulator [Streptosporangiaceae bacterium]|nr:BTAD domain-containing putative transcriptional regulator [Streptosporangiaceae bacterium]
MAANGGVPLIGRYADRNAPSQARTALSEALTELRKLIQDPYFNGSERALADLGSAPIGSASAVDTVRKLRQWSAEYQRMAIELETAARYCRLADRDINERVDALLDTPQAESRRRVGPLRDLLRRGRAPAPPVVHLTGPAASEPEPISVPVPAIPVTADPAPEADITASALGPLEVRVAGRCVPRWNNLKARAVFQYLLVHQDRPTRRDVLMALQWPDHSHSSARNNLNVALYSLRNTLDGLGRDAQPIVYGDGCYRLNPDLTWWIDRTEFLSALEDARRARQADRLRQVIAASRRAIGLYRGPLFEDDVASEWYLPEQRRLKDLYGRALEDVAGLYYKLGEVSEALQFGQLAIGNDACSEIAHRLLMRCYASQHQQQLVSRQYQVCVAALREELGVSPSVETTQLLRALT